VEEVMPNEILDAIATRYSCRAFTDEPVSRADLDSLALAAAQAPSARHNAPWHVVIVTNRQFIDDIHRCAVALLRRHDREIHKAAKTGSVDLFFHAPAMILVATRNTHDFTPAELDAGLLVENVALAATGLGLGTCICGSATQAFRDRHTDDGERLSRALGFPWGYEMTVSVLVGHPAGTGTPHTPDLSKIHYIE